MTQYIWRVKTRLPERYKTLYKVIARGKMNSCLVEFEDGYRVVTSRNYLMKFETICTAVNDTNRTKKDTKDTSEDLTPY